MAQWGVPSRLMQRLALLPAVALLSLFVWGGSRPEAAGLIPSPWDKLAHLVWFALLAGLLHVGLGLRRGIVVMLFCAGVGLWDEWRQLSLPGRSAGWVDLLFDGLGIGVGVWLAMIFRRGGLNGFVVSAGHG